MTTKVPTELLLDAGDFGSQLLATETQESARTLLSIGGGGGGGASSYIDLADAYGVIGDDSGDATKVQQAFDEAPIGSTLRFPPGKRIVTTVPLVLSRMVNLDMTGCAIRGDFTGSTTHDVIRIDITDAGPGVSGVRELTITGGRVFCNGGGNCAININSTPSGGFQPHFETVIQRGNYAGQLRGIRIGGANVEGDTNFNTVKDCTISTIASNAVAGVDLDGCADGHRISDNMIFGIGTAVRLNLVLGAFQTIIENNCLVARNGAVLIVNGARVVIRGNQMEQQSAGNSLVPKCHVLVQGLSYVSHGIIIEDNNFGAGANVDISIVLYNAQSCVIDKNYFFNAAVQDILFGNGGGGLAAKYNTVGPNNHARGTRTLKTTDTDSGRRLSINHQAGADGNRGYWRNDISMNASWVNTDLRFLVDGYGILHLAGTLTGGLTTGGTIMAQFPTGCAPLAYTPLPFASATGTLGIVGISTSGQMSASVIPASPNNTVYLSHASYPVSWLAAYDIGA